MDTDAVCLLVFHIALTVKHWQWSFSPWCPKVVFLYLCNSQACKLNSLYTLCVRTVRYAHWWCEHLLLCVDYVYAPCMNLYRFFNALMESLQACHASYTALRLTKSIKLARYYYYYYYCLCWRNLSSTHKKDACFNAGNRKIQLNLLSMCLLHTHEFKVRQSLPLHAANCRIERSIGPLQVGYKPHCAMSEWA